VHCFGRVACGDASGKNKSIFKYVMDAADVHEHFDGAVRKRLVRNNVAVMVALVSADWKGNRKTICR
jgi:hypothetical protein